MIIVGARGFAKELLEIFHQLNKTENLAFYDDINSYTINTLYKQFKILRNKSEVIEFFSKNGNDFTIGIGNPKLRYKLYNEFLLLGGSFISSISPRAILGSFDVVIGNGCNVLDNAIFSNSTSIGKGCIVYYNVLITHDCIVDDFVELSPGVTLLGACKIGSFSSIGSNATILPKIIIGNNVIVGAGAVVTKDIPDNSLAVGVPAKVIRKLNPLC